ncbi:MAG: phenylalanine--tRNA ligase subunit beta [Verrucomicrobiales bacterium]|nr:phenylalanine--tRNA ligase subunit beta [Verrucomicrobiales bacterium]
MNVSLQWLSDHVDFSEYSMPELDDLLTFAGIEVEGIQSLPDHLVVAEVLSSDKHPDADKLSVCQVDDGSGTPRQIVCGAKNYQVGDKVPLALPGCVLDAGDGKTFEIKEGKLRGVESLGMMCAASEIGLTDDADGLLILSPDLKPGTPLSEVYPAVFELEITPNRPDCLSHLGVARELAALAKKPLTGVSHYGNSTTPTRVAKDEEIRISTDSCPYYTARIIRGVQVGESPAWLKQKLESIGLRPINNVVDITNYVLMEMGQPLHAFDMAKLDGGIHVRPAKSEEEFVALDGETYVLDDTDMVIADSKKAVAIGGVMGGEDSGVTESTTDVLLESAYFIPSAIRRTARTLNLHSDSSYRFERGADAYQVNGASDLAVKLILDLAGGEAEEEIVTCGNLPDAPGAVALDNDNARSVIGSDISDGEISSILESLGLECKGGEWEMPTYRLDLPRPVDLVEEVARVYGLDKVPSNQKAWFSPASKADASFDFASKIQTRLSGLGFFETRNLKLISEAQLADDLATNHRGMSPVRLKNPLNDEQDYLRPGLVPGLLATAERNVRFGNPDLRLFETGRVFTATPKGGEVEHEHLALLMTGASAPRSWAENDAEGLDIHDLRAALDQICPDSLHFQPVEDDRLLCACSIEIGSGKKSTKLGLAGIVSPARARELGIESPVMVAEINLKKLMSAASGEAKYEELPRFPGSSRDIAMVVPAEMEAGEVAAFFESHNEPLLQSFELFDVFQDPSGEKLPADKKSLAWSISYLSPERTLEAAEVESAHSKLLDSLTSGLNVEFR